MARSRRAATSARTPASAEATAGKPAGAAPVAGTTISAARAFLLNACFIAGLLEHAREIIAVTNQKGGVGKTTIAAAVFREMQKATAKRILLVDFDSQYNLTQLLVTGARCQELLERKRTLWHVLRSARSMVPEFRSLSASPRRLRPRSSSGSRWA